jgi:hypothetical protein
MQDLHPIQRFYTRRVVAVIAAQHGKMSPRIRIVSFLDVFHPSPVYADGDVVFFLARHRARMAADASVLVYKKSVAHLLPFESEN